MSNDVSEVRLPQLSNLLRASALIELGQEAEAMQLLDVIGQELGEEIQPGDAPVQGAMARAQYQALRQDPEATRHWIELHRTQFRQTN